MQTDQKYDVGIISGWSNVGGSTECFVNLTNALNKDGISTVFIGPAHYHVDRCNGIVFSPNVDNLSFKNIISHFINYPPLDNKFWKDSNHIVSCHETSVNPVFKRYQSQIKAGLFDYFHFVSEDQLQYQLEVCNIKRSNKMKIIPNLIDPSLENWGLRHDKICGRSGKIAGIIGSIDTNKNTHVSIEKALADGCNIVNIYGMITDNRYFSTMIEPLLKNPKVKYMGVQPRKNMIYNCITDVYHYSLNETWGYIKAECQTLGIPFHSFDKKPLKIVSEGDILRMWKELLK
jgi:hypothetical protein